MKKKVLVGLILLSVLAFGVAYEQPCIAGGCVDKGSSYDGWLSPDYETSPFPECVRVSDEGETISVLVEDMDCGGSQAAYFYVMHSNGSTIHDGPFDAGDSETYGGMELYINQIFCGTEYDAVEIELGYESPPPPPPCSGIYGDVNDNGYINSLDAMMVSQYVGGSLTLTDCQLERADVATAYGVVNSTDASCILQYAVGNSCGRAGQSLP